MRRHLPRGFNLIEIVLALAVLSAAIPATVQVFAIAFQEESHTSLHTRAVFLANSLMGEISGRRFEESSTAPGNGADAGETNGLDRRDFDDIDDYAQFRTWGPLNPPVDEQGTAQADYSHFTETVEVVNVAAPTAGPTGRSDYDIKTDGSTPFKMVKVKISWDQERRDVTLYKIFARH